MARILYGVHGTGHGHAMRALILARGMPWHEFIFVADDDATTVLAPEFQVECLPNLGTVFKNYRVDIGATIRRALPLLLERKRYIRQALNLIEKFQPDVCMVDLEYFVPAAAALTGLPCLTLDHQHILTCCEHRLPPDLLWDAFLQGLTPRLLFRPTAANILISFYQAPLRPKFNALVAPPILRQKTLDLKPENGSHILVYQSNSTDSRLLSCLKKIPRRQAHIFGYRDEELQDGNLHFHKRDEDRFNELLGSCAYVIQGGSHTLMSEALYLGKPILSLPLRAMVEQRLNALYLERLGYGLKTSIGQLEPELLQDFEARLPEFRNNIAGRNFAGNELVFGLVDKFAATAALPDFGNLQPQ